MSPRPSRSCGPFIAAVALSAAAFAPFSTAQTEVSHSRRVKIDVDSGWVENDSTLPSMRRVPAVIFSKIVHVPNSSWLRLSYEGVRLSGDESEGTGSFLRITSLFDNALMTQQTEHVAQWQHTSAYFNGDAVKLEILAYPGTGPNRIVLRTAEAGEPPPPRTICGGVDDRALSSDPRTARNQPTGCTSWMINDCNHCFLTAGHCSGGLQVVQFNVPLSNNDRSLNHPPPSDQYAVDQASMQSNGGQGVGNDYAYFGVFENSTTGLTPYEAQGMVAFNLASTPPPVSGQNIRITGYGTTSTPVSNTWNQVQKTHSGPYFSFIGTTVRYTTDTTGGNSGSPVIDDSTGNAIGIHTHGGCDPANHGTGSNHAALNAALANPQGVCRPGLDFDYPNGLPDRVDPAGGTTVRVVVSGSGAHTPQPGSGQFHYDAGGGFVTVPMQQVQNNVYDAVFPQLPCPGSVAFYFSAEDTNQRRFSNPLGAPNTTFSALVAAGEITVVEYDFQSTPAGWTVQNTALTTGAWVRAVPVGSGGSRSDPPTDFDGSGACWVTGNALSEDVDGGPTRLITEVFDLSGRGDPQVSFALWAATNGGDPFDVEVFDGSTSQWVLMERLNSTNGWEQRTFKIGDFVNDLSQVRFRFSQTDNPNNSVTEGGLDAFKIFDAVCVRADWRSVGAGCAGTAGIPALAPVQGDLPVSGESFDVALTNLPPASTQVIGVLGFTNTQLDLGSIGASGCIVETDLTALIPLNNVGGVATWSLQIPGDASFLGGNFFQQGFVVDPGANQLGGTVSNAGEGTIGGL